MQKLYFMCHLIRHGRFDDNSLGEKIGIKAHQQPLDLQGELIIFIFFIQKVAK